MAKQRRELQDGKRVTVWLSSETIEIADRLALKADMERGRLLRNLIEMDIQALERSDKVGVFQMSVLIRDMGENLKAWVSACQSEPEEVGKAVA